LFPYQVPPFILQQNTSLEAIVQVSALPILKHFLDMDVLPQYVILCVLLLQNATSDNQGVQLSAVQAAR
jgi:hypothetical protein